MNMKLFESCESFDSAETITNNLFCKEAMAKFEQIRREGKMCDVLIKVEDVQFSAHRVVLAATIPYFNTMFTTDMVEASMKEISMQGIEKNAMEALINYAYSGTLTVTIHNVQSIIMGANFLQLKQVKDYCCDFIKKRLKPNNCLEIRNFAELFMCVVLLEKTESYIKQRFVEVSKTEEFLQLPLNDVIRLISQSELNVASEEQVYDAAIGWVEHDRDNRSDQMHELLQLVRLPLMKLQYLIDIVQKHPIINLCLKCRDLIDKAKDYHLMPDRRSNFPPNMIRSRCCTDIQAMIYAIGGVTSCGEALNIVEKFSPIVGRWEVITPLGTCRSRVGVAVLAGQLYAIGGYDGKERLNTVEMFLPDTNEWCNIKPMYNKRSALSCIACDGQIYVCGGYDGIKSLNSCEVYKSHTADWEYIKPMHKARSASAVAVFNRQLCVLGGHDGLQIFNSVEMYNTEKDEWVMGVPMLSKRCRHAVATLHGLMFVFGGYDGQKFLDTVEVFDPVSEQWSYMASMSMRRSRVGVQLSGGKFYALGGYDGCSNLSTVEVYDPETNTWSPCGRMYAHEGGVGVGAIPFGPM